ncbi:MAG: superoxide dismutase [Gemmatimonadaceae bacterium]
MTRRQALAVVSAAPALLVPSRLNAQPATPAKGPFSLPALPYAVAALEPHIDSQTMQIHHSKHHAAYVNNLNNAVAAHPELAGKSVEELVRGWQNLPASVRTAVRNNGGGHWNHSLFWELMAPNAGGEPGGDVGAAVTKTWGNFGKFRDAFKAAAVGRFGSGWAWLVAGRDGALTIESTPNQDNPLMDGKHAILGLDVWEHAYYLKYQNRRPDYIDAWWNVVNWGKVAERYSAR